MSGPEACLKAGSFSDVVYYLTGSLQLAFDEPAETDGVLVAVGEDAAGGKPVPPRPTRLLIVALHGLRQAEILAKNDPISMSMPAAHCIRKNVYVSVCLSARECVSVCLFLCLNVFPSA